MEGQGFADTIIVNLRADRPSTLWVRQDSAVIFFSEGREVGHGNLNAASRLARPRMIGAIGATMEAIEFGDSQALTVPAPTSNLTTMFRAIEAVNKQIVGVLPDSYYFPRPPGYSQ